MHFKYIFKKIGMVRQFDSRAEVLGFGEVERGKTPRITYKIGEGGLFQFLEKRLKRVVQDVP